MPVSRLTEVPEREALYPEFSMFGELPSWGFYVRHVEGLTMKNVKISIAAPDYRPAMIFDDVHLLQLKAIAVHGDIKPKPIILHNSSDIKTDDEQSILRM